MSTDGKSQEGERLTVRYICALSETILQGVLRLSRGLSYVAILKFTVLPGFQLSLASGLYYPRQKSTRTNGRERISCKCTIFFAVPTHKNQQNKEIG